MHCGILHRDQGPDEIGVILVEAAFVGKEPPPWRA
jgi:hypothetical protein